MAARFSFGGSHFTLKTIAIQQLVNFLTYGTPQGNLVMYLYIHAIGEMIEVTIANQLH